MPREYNAFPLRRVFALSLLALFVCAPAPGSAHAAVPARIYSPAAEAGSEYRMHMLDDSAHALDRLNFAPSGSTAILPRQVTPSTNPLVRREVFGFAPYWNLSKYAEWNYSLMSTVAYFGLDVNPDGTFATQGGGWNGWNSANLTAMINLAHASGDRVVLVIKNFDTATINYITNTNSYQTLVTQTINAIASKNLDGVNVDFEATESPLFPDVQSGITHLMTAMSQGVHARWPQAEVSIDTYAGSASWDGGVFKIGDLAPVVDAFFIMAYDSVFSNMPGYAGPNAPLNGWTYNDTVDVAQYLTKAPASKIILGVPYYGYVWNTVTSLPNAQTVSGATAVTYTGVQQALGCGAVAQVNGWDPLGQSPYMGWWSPATNDPCGDNLGMPREMYYDNATSLGLKYDLVNANNLRGTGMWTLGYDSGYQDLWNELAVKFTTTTPWYTMGGIATSSPHVSSWGSTRSDAFVRGSDNGVWTSTFNGTTWSSWASLGGVITSDAAAVSWGPNRIDVFARGSDSALWHTWWDGTKWWGWQSLGGILASGPEVASWGPNRLDVLVQGTDRGLWHLYWDGTAWRGWEPLGGVLTSDPAAVSWGPNRLDIFARGTDNALWHRWWDSATLGWHSWERLGGYLITSPAAASCSAGHMDVFAVGSDSAAYQLGYTGTWGGWQRLGGQWMSDPGAVCPPATTGVELLAKGPDGAIWQTTVTGS